MTTIDLTEKLKQVFTEEDAKLIPLEAKLVSLSDELVGATTKEEALKLASILQYNIIALRTKINFALSQLKQMSSLDGCTLNEPSKLQIKVREQNLLQKTQRLTELREDLNSLQKLAYTLKSYNLFN